METKVKITEEQRAEATGKVIDSTIYQIVLKEANIKFKEEELKLLDKLATKEEKAQRQLVVNMLKKQKQELVDILSFLQK